ncbi:MAG: hypothetical protein A4E32_01024 [Methanomassiliicoccales archaeon PtaU1.Bin124]|nr:MAG: hypothetical protein A4E32_01024 [Methanomassiliicoccales archaeon PtaU1.Bin124]
MRSEEIQQQLDSLRDEVRRMSRSLDRVREDDVRWVFGEQIRPIILQNVKRWFENAEREGTLQGRASAALEASMYELVERTLSVYQRFDLVWAEQVLDQGAKEIRDRFRLLEGSPSERILADLVAQMTEYFSTSSIIDKDLEIGTGKGQNEMIPEPISGSLVESVLSPLASAVRYDIMVTLKVRERGLTDLGRSLDMQKGHLQFHMRSLVNSGYISLDKATRQYSLTKKGELALGALEGLVRQLSVN